MPKPLLILSDSISGQTGFSRIARDLATRIHENLQDVFRVGVLGFGGNYSRKFPFPQYHTQTANGNPIMELPDVWRDFAGDDLGIILAIWNVSWVGWITHCDRMPNSPFRAFLEDAPFELWGYFPIDGWTPSMSLHHGLLEVISRCDRVLAYTPTARAVMSRSGRTDIDYIPHGIDTEVFRPIDKAAARLEAERLLQLPYPITDDILFLGCVATNTARKDWPLLYRTARAIRSTGKKVLVWGHTDTLTKHWDHKALAREFGEEGIYLSAGNLPESIMATLYSACDVTLGIGAGEGFGYPIFESIACGTPCIHGRYGSAPDHLPANYTVSPKGMYLDGVWMNQRPVFDVGGWAERVMDVAGSIAELPEALKWENVWPRWEQWLKSGVE